MWYNASHIGVFGRRKSCGLPWSLSNVQHTVPLILHFICPPTPETATLHFCIVPETKSLRDVVRLLDEQLSMATCFKSESNAIASPMPDAAMQVIETNFIPLAILLFASARHRLRGAAMNIFVRGLLSRIPGNPSRDLVPLLSVIPSVTASILLVTFPIHDSFDSCLLFLATYAGASGGTLAGSNEATLAWMIVGIHAIGPSSLSTITICSNRRHASMIACRIRSDIMVSMMIGISMSADMAVVGSLPASPHSIIGQIHLVVWLWRQWLSTDASSSESSIAWSAELIWMSLAVISTAPPFALCAASSSLYFGCSRHKLG
jgi:hypothetical protein